MKKKRSSLVNLLVFLILMSVCIILILSAWIVFSLPAQAASLFGPANPDLAIQQHIYLSARLLLQEKELTQAGSPDGEPQTFEIQLGETTPEITRRLQSQGILTNSQVFRDYLVYSGLDTSIQAGQYSLIPR